MENVLENKIKGKNMFKVENILKNDFYRQRGRTGESLELWLDTAKSLSSCKDLLQKVPGVYEQGMISKHKLTYCLVMQKTDGYNGL